MTRQSTSIWAVNETPVKNTSEQKHLDRLRQVRQILVTYFDEGELRTLCFDLGIDYDDLPGEGKANKARELVAYLERHGRISELVEIGRQMRPNISWSDVPKATKEVSIPQSPSPEWSQDTTEVIKKVAFVKRCPSLRVFVSSTFKDLKVERQAVKRAVSLCGCVPRLAEDADMQPRKGIVDQIAYWLRDIDLLILLVCVRYGELSPSKLSWTEEEVREAARLGKLIFPYFITRKIPAGIEMNEQQKERVKKFKSWLTSLENQQPPQYLENVQELVIRVARDIGALQSDYRVMAIMDEVLAGVRTKIEKEEQERRDSYENGFLD